jgi:hypothetical protein
MVDVHSHAPAPLVALGAALLLLEGASCQGTGQWAEHFQHEHATPRATDAEFPFWSPILRPVWPSRFNAVHMSLIPVGPHRGKVLVWDAGETIAFADPWAPGPLWSFQRYAIVDPDPNAATRFFNYFLPMAPLTPTPGALDLFCSGHAWSPFGYLVVAGGTEHVLADMGFRLVYTFDPRFDNAPFPGYAGPLYPGSPGTRWRDEQIRLRADRYYPTVTSTRRFPRPPAYSGAPTAVEVALVCGGSANPQPSQGVQVEWFSYEALLLLDSQEADEPRVFTDSMKGFDQWWGPVDPATPTDPVNPAPDGFHEYPRMHFLSNARVFHAGDLAASAQVDHSFAPGSTMPKGWSGTSAFVQRWDPSAGVPGPSSQFRHACTTVHFARIGLLTDLVVRIGGASIAGAPLPTCEACPAGAPGSWLSAPAVPDLVHAREHATAVALPDGSIFVVGGESRHAPIRVPELFRWGTGQWVQQPPHESARGYHSTAVLLDDGSVLVAGANERTWDYEIYLPPYLMGTPPLPRPSGISIANPSSVDADGTPVLSRPTGRPVHGFNVLCNNAAETLDFALAKAVLLTPGSVTHSGDMHQRYFECQVIPVSPTTLQVTAPGESQAPRGYYRLFVLSTAGVPSKALWIRLA